MAYPQGDKDGSFYGARPGLPGKDHTVEEKGAIGSLEPPPVEGGHCLIEGLCHPAYRGGAYPLPQDGKEGLAHLAGGQAEEKAGEDETVHIL